MPPLNEYRNDPVEKKSTGEGLIDTVEIDGCGAGLSALLTLPPRVPLLQYGERRSGRDRRTAERRLTAREFTVSNESP